MSTIVTRAAKGSPLTHAEVDANFTNLNNDKFQEGNAIGNTTPAAGTFTTLTGNGTSQFGRSSANYIQATGNTTTNSPEISALGSDTNIPLTLESKGTGAINLGAGSRGVNVSNGMTVTALTVTSGGSGYTSIPSVTISASTTAGGVQATATATMFRGSSTIVSGGTGYTVNDVITVVGGTFTQAVIFTVATVSGGVVTSLTVTNGGTYSVLPTGTLSTTGGTGSGLTVTIDTWGVRGLTITNAGSGYVEQPTVTFSGGGGSGAAAYATVGGVTSIRSLGSSMAFYTPNGGIGFSVADQGTSTTQGYLSVQGNSANSLNFALGGSGSNTSIYWISRGTGQHSFTTNGSTGTEQFRVAHTASAVNYVQVTGAATTATPVVSAQGSDTNISISLRSKGSGFISFANAVGQFGAYVNPVSGGANHIELRSAVASSGPMIATQGSDTNIDLNLTTKGTGAVKFNTGGGEQLRVSNTASAVNYVQVTGGATGVTPVISAQGSDSNVAISLVSKGIAAVSFLTNSSIQFDVYGGVTAVNRIRASGSVASSAPSFSCVGSDTNIDLALTPKGTGLVRFGTRTATSDVAITGYLEIKDSGGTTRKLAIID